MPIHNGATMSIIGLYNWNNTIFDNMVLPTGIDKNEIIEDILFTCADLEILYPDWDVMARAIQTWSKEALYRWNKIQILAQANYNPLENYDMMESESVQDNRTRTGESKSAGASGTSTKNDVTGYNSDTPVTNTIDTTTETGNSANTTEEKSAGNYVRNNRRHGNLGVMTPADMIKKELEVYPQLNLYSIIPTEFKMRFCLMVY